MSLRTDHYTDDPWMVGPSGFDASSPAAGDQPALRIDRIDGVVPLGTQLGVFPKQTVPDRLHEVLFGQPEPTAAELRAAGGDAAAVPPMQTYAVLDAAKLANLPELMERGKVEHRCLFKGEAYDALKNVAPWIVRLSDGCAFTRGLFTRSDAGWHLWDDQPGIYIRSRGTLNDVWRHFRRLTRVRDEAGTWFYLRFWEAETAEVLWAAYDDQPDHVAWRFGEVVATVCWPAGDGFVCVSRACDRPAGSAAAPAIDAYRPLLRAARWNRFVRRIGAALGREGHPFDMVSTDRVTQLCDAARRAGYRSEAAIWDAVRAMILHQAAGRDPTGERLEAWRDADAPDERTEARQLLARARLGQAETG